MKLTLLLFARCLDFRAMRHLATKAANATNTDKLVKQVGEQMMKYTWVEKLIFNSFLDKYTAHGFEERIKQKRGSQLVSVQERVEKQFRLPSVSVKYFQSEELEETVEYTEQIRSQDHQELLNSEVEDSKYDGQIQYPYRILTEFSHVSSGGDEASRKGKDKMLVSNSQITASNDTDGHAEESLEEESAEEVHGMPDPDYPASNIPCGGCGALLHCRDTGVPGYMSSERFKQLNEVDLLGEICQRCYYLKTHKAALSVNVSPDDYPRILSQMQRKRGLVLLLVDLVDFPCSIWPGIANIIGENRPVILVGNKLDLIPRDSKKYLEHIKSCLKQSAEEQGLDTCRIVHTELISAVTGYGVEELITAIHRWPHKDDIYILGCANVGKSTLFNTLLRSDLCRIDVADVVQRATVSTWPGTTLNLLKFPLVNYDRYKNYLRQRRLRKWYKDVRIQNQLQQMNLRQTKSLEYSGLVGEVGRSWELGPTPEKMFWAERVGDHFHVNTQTKNTPQLFKPGVWDPEKYAHCQWCFDTPGTVNKNQILSLLMLPELMKVLPKKSIQPRTFWVRPLQTLFLGGLARVDVSEETQAVRMTVFASKQLPITIVDTEYAEEIYEKAVGTPILGVPLDNPSRLKEMPPFVSRNFQLRGLDLNYSCGDIVFSGIGWVGITAREGEPVYIKAHTPNGAGVFCRQSSLLPYMIRLRGRRFRSSAAYGKHRAYIPGNFMPF